MKIKAKMTRQGDVRRDWVNRIPVVTESNHPRFVVGSRFDWGFVQVALGDGYSVEIEPDDINASNCNHEKGFVRSGLKTEHDLIYICPVCKEFRYRREILDVLNE